MKNMINQLDKTFDTKSMIEVKAIKELETEFIFFKQTKEV
jgi:hypothetical protein